MNKLIKTDNPNFVMRDYGALINVNEQEFQNYKRQRDALVSKDKEITELTNRINILEDRMTKLISALENK